EAAEEEGESDYDEAEESLDDEEETEGGCRPVEQGGGRALWDCRGDLRGTRRRPDPEDENPAPDQGEHPVRFEACGMEVCQPDGRTEREEVEGRAHAAPHDARARVHPGHDPR